MFTPLPIPSEPCVNLSMDFVLVLPRSKRRNDSIYVAVDRFFNKPYFIPYHKIDDATHITKLFFKEVVKLHGIPKIIVSDC